MASAFGFDPQPQQVAPGAQAVGMALLQRRMAMQPQNAQSGFPAMLPGNTMRGQLPAVGQRLLKANPQTMPTPAGQEFGGGQ